jgi:hypothetical protein
VDRALTPEEREMLLKLTENAPRGNKLDRAKRAGVDLHVLIENLCLSPEQRIRKMEARVNRMLERGRRKKLQRDERKRKSTSLGSEAERAT